LTLRVEQARSTNKASRNYRVDTASK
jgi:hypothetical protein